MALALVAFGGNALLRPEDDGTGEEERRRSAEAAEWLVVLLQRGYDLVVVHGNGPQVGNVLIQMEEAASRVPPRTLDVAVAQTQGAVGYLLELGLREGLRQAGIEAAVTSVLSLVVVDRDDPDLSTPSKPVGPFFTRFRAEALRREHGWTMVEDAGRGFRKVVPSPRPVEVLGLAAVRALLGGGRGRQAVIAGGGGGIPVVRSADGSLRGVEAVIDKDRTAALMARSLGADLLLVLTGVAQVMRNFGKRHAQPLPLLSLRQARRLLTQGQFPAGSMGPKIDAAMDFVAGTGRPAMITSVEALPAALAGESGTVIVRDLRDARSGKLEKALLREPSGT